jgi:hypothetical protein
MTIKPQYSLFGERADRSSKLYWLNVGLSINDIIRLQRTIPNSLVIRPRPSSLQYCVLRGIGTAENVLTVGEKGTDFDHFAVDVAPYVQTEENSPTPELHRSAKMIWSEVDPRSPRLEIYIMNTMLRHLVELYVTKRIEAVKMFIKIVVIEWTMADSNTISEILPLLDRDGHLHFRRMQCELLSVYVS